MSELKSCPFCGNTEIEIQHCHTSSVDPAKREPYFPIGCPECGAWIGSERTEEEAITAWNSRATDWVPVSERLPKYGDTVLTYIKHNYSNTDGFRAYRVYEFIDRFKGMGNLCEVIAWCELPKPPNE